jgi:hypothetical protein
MRKLFLVLCLFAFSCAGYMTEAPIYRHGAYLRKCEYINHAVCCNYADAESMCSSRWCNGMWQREWEVVYEYCPGEEQQRETVETGERL